MTWVCTGEGPLEAGTILRGTEKKPGSPHREMIFKSKSYSIRLTSCTVEIGVLLR